MKTHDKIKQEYFTPVIKRIELDNEISLALESAPPIGPDEGYLKAPEYLKSDPFKTNVG